MAAPLQQQMQVGSQRPPNYGQYGGQPQVPPGQQQQQTPQQQHDNKLDPIIRVKQLVEPLKKTLGVVMQLAAKFIYYNSTVDSSMKPNETIQQRFDKALEEFYAICDQIESNLVLAAECHGQFIDSNRHFQMLVASGNKTEQGSQYGQYLATVKTQISFAKELHDALLECVSRMSTKQ